jgi:hypothetical protein
MPLRPLIARPLQLHAGQGANLRTLSGLPGLSIAFVRSVSPLVTLVARKFACLAANHLIPIAFTSMTWFPTGLAPRPGSRGGRPRFPEMSSFPGCCEGDVKIKE